MAITHHPDGGTTFTGADVQLYRLISLKHQLRLEALGMKSSGGPIRPRIAQEFKLKPRASREAYIRAVEAKLAELGYKKKEPQA